MIDHILSLLQLSSTHSYFVSFPSGSLSWQVVSLVALVTSPLHSPGTVFISRAFYLQQVYRNQLKEKSFVDLTLPNSGFTLFCYRVFHPASSRLYPRSSMFNFISSEKAYFSNLDPMFNFLNLPFRYVFCSILTVTTLQDNYPLRRLPRSINPGQLT